MAIYVLTNSYAYTIFLTVCYKKMDSATVFLKHIESKKIMKLNFWEANMQDMTPTKIVCKINYNKVANSFAYLCIL